MSYGMSYWFDTHTSLCLDLFQGMAGMVDQIDRLERRVAELERNGSARSRRGSGSNENNGSPRGRRGQRAIRSAGPIRVPTPIPVPRFGMVARLNGEPLVLGAGDSAENPFVLREVIDLTEDQEEEAGPSTHTSRHRVLVDLTNEIPAEDPPAYE